MKTIQKLSSKLSFPCFYCSADSQELRYFLLITIGGMVLCSLLVFLGLLAKGAFKNVEQMSDAPLRVDTKEDI